MINDEVVAKVQLVLNGGGDLQATSAVVSTQNVATVTGFLPGPTGNTGPKGDKGDKGDSAGSLTSSAARTSSFTASPNTYYPVDATTGATTVTLPTSLSGQEIAIKKIDTSENTVIITGTINGVASTTLPLRLQNQGKVLIPDGSGGWNVYAGDISLPSLDTRYTRGLMKVYNITNYGAIGDGYDTGIANQHYNASATDNTAAIKAAITAIQNSTAKVGILYTPDGCFMTDQITIPQGVSLKGNGRGQSGWILKSGSTTPTLVISAGFATAAGQQYGSYGGTSYFNIDDMFFDGNHPNQTTVANAPDYRDQNAILKLYSWHFGIRNIDIRNAKENGMYTEYVDQWSDSFNAYQFAESYFENVYVKTYGGAGWCNRGPHDLSIKNVYISSYYNANGNYTGVTPYVGYVQQSSGASGKYYSSGGVVAYNLHVWGQHLTNSVYLDGSNIIDGWMYAEGAQQANLKLVNSSGNKFKAEVGYCGQNVTTTGTTIQPAVELFGASNYNYIEAKVESNVTGPLFQIDTNSSYNYLAHTGGYNRPNGAVFNLIAGGTYTGVRNTFIPSTAYTGTIFAGIPNQLDNVGLDRISTINADDYGAAGDDTTDDAVTINAAIAAAPEGGTIQLSARKYRINSPIYLTRNKTLRGTQGLRWRYAVTPGTYLKPRSTFTGLAAIIMQDKEQGGYATEQGGQRIENLNVDLSALTSGTADGILASGLIRDVRLDHVSVSYARGKCFRTISYTRADNSVQYPRGWELSHCVADTGFDNGFSFNNLTDSSLNDCLAVGNAVNGFSIAGSGENLITACRAVFNKNNGFLITGSTFGTTSLVNCSTDRNEYNGVLINTTGTNTAKYPITLTALNLRRDGRNGNTAGGSYAGLAVASSTSPVIVDNVQVVQGVDDNGTGISTPVYGINATGSDLTITSGHIWGNTTAVFDGGSNTNLTVNQAVQLATGAITATKTTVKSGGLETSGYVLTAQGAGKSPAWGVVPADASKAPINSPAFTGTPTSPTATAGDNSQQIANTAFVTAAILAAAQSYDDVKEASTFANLPATGKADTIYYVDDTGLLYRWSGSAYVQVGGGAVNDATTTSKGIIQLAGDLAGTATAPTVPGLANKQIYPTQAAAQTASFTAAANTLYLVSASSTNVTVTLPTSTAGQAIYVKKTDANALTGATTGIVTLSGTINGVSSSSIPLRYINQAKRLNADGSGGWTVVNGDLDITSLYAVAQQPGTIQLTGDLGGTATAPTTPTAVHVTGNENVAGTKNFTSQSKMTEFLLTGGGTNNSRVYQRLDGRTTFTPDNVNNTSNFFEVSNLPDLTFEMQSSTNMVNFQTYQAALTVKSVGSYPLNLYAGNQIVNTNSSRFTGLMDPTAAQDAATKNYVDTNQRTRVVTQVTAATTAATATKSDFWYYWTGSTAYAVTLPTATGSTNRYTFKNLSTVNQTVTAASGQTVDLSASFTIIPNQSVSIISYGTSWMVD